MDSGEIKTTTEQGTHLDCVVAATDLSDSGDIVVAWSLAIARAHGAKLHIVHAIARTVPLLQRWDPTSPFTRPARVAAQKQLDELEARLKSEWPEIETHLLSDRPSASTIKVAEWERAKLIVQSATRHRGVHRVQLGSTAERVAERAVCPVLSLRPDTTPISELPKKVLICTDFSLESDAAILAGIEVVQGQKRSAEFQLLTVLETPVGLESEPELESRWADYKETCQAMLQGRLDFFLSIAGAGTSEPRSKLLEGVPAEVIVDLARKEDVDLIVLGSRGTFTAGRGILGSVSKRVMQTAPCPVLTVPSLLSRRMRNPARY
ncbi:MAG: universal stress protein [Acidobacteriota bacterium]